MKLKFWGVRGSIPTPGKETAKYGGNTTCIEISFVDNSAETIIIDCGTGLRKLGEELYKNCKKNIKLLLTHSHWDHIQGFPFFMPAYDKDTKIEIFSCEMSNKKLKDILTNQMEFSYFPVDFKDLQAGIKFIDKCPTCFNDKKVGISTITASHPGGCQGFKFVKNNKSLVFLTDNELNQKKMSGKYDSIVKFCENIDVLIHDANYTELELQTHRGWGHSSFEQTYQLAIEANAKKVYFFHHAPERSDTELDKIMTKYLKKNDGPKCFAAKELETIQL